MPAYKKSKDATDWKDFEQLCKDIEQNPDKYNWIIIDPLFGIITKSEKGESRVSPWLEYPIIKQQ